MNALRTPAFLTTVVAALFAQTAPPSPSFEVASFKLAGPGSVPSNAPVGYYIMTGGPGTNSPGQFRCASVTLQALVLKAYDLRPYQLAAQPSIDGPERYDIVAAVPDRVTKEQFNGMIRNLLAERLGLTVHWETRELPIYELTVAKGGPKLREPEKAQPGAQAASEPPGAPADGRGQPLRLRLGQDGVPVTQPGKPDLIAVMLNGGVRLSARMKTVGDLLRALSSQIGRPVVDKTGLTGIYDYTLVYSPLGVVRPPGATANLAGSEGGSQPAIADAASDPAPTLTSAFETQLGLKLESKKGPVEVLIVDRVHRTPTEN